MTIHQRKTIGLGLIAKTVITMYTRRTILCFSLFVGQPFLYNAFFSASGGQSERVAGGSRFTGSQLPTKGAAWQRTPC